MLSTVLERPMSSSMQTLDLLGGGSLHPQHHEGFDLHSDTPLPSGWEMCLDLKTGSIYYLNRSTGLSTSCDPRKPTSKNWPTSPSSSDLLTAEATLAKGSNISSPNKPSKYADNFDTENLDLSLSLKPSLRSSARLLDEADQEHQQRIECHHSAGRLFCQPKGQHKNHCIGSANNTTCLPSTASSSSALSFQDINIVMDGGRCSSKSPNYKVESIAKPISSNTNPMITVGCANCLMMFIMLPGSRNPKCPRCEVTLNNIDVPQRPKKARLDFSLTY